MRIGDYVRTKDYGIHKISNLEHYDYIDYIMCENQFNIIKIDKSNIIKSSPNIIDLIEVGDVFSFEDGSICRIIEIDKELNPPYYLLKDYGGETYWERQECLSDLQSIVTKEQFKSMEYKVDGGN